MTSKASLCGIALLLSILAGCSSIQLAYGQLDRWLRWQIDDYVDFEGNQKRQLQVALDSFHRWHRQTQLPRYADFLEELAGQLERKPPQEIELAPIEERVEHLWNTASTQLIDLLLPLAAQLSPQQIDYMERKLREKREESLRKWQKSPGKVQQRRLKQIRKQSERWLGSLSAEQEQLIAGWVAQMAYNPLLRDQQRQVWQSHFIGLLRDKPEGYLQKMRDLLQNPEQLWSDEYRQVQENRERQARALSEQILASATEKQRHHLIATLREYARDFRALAQK